MCDARGACAQAHLGTAKKRCSMSGSGAAPALHHGRRSTTTATAASASASTASAALPARSLPPCPFAASPPPPSSARRGWRPAMELEQSRSVTCRPDTAAGNAQLSCGLVKPERRTGATGCHCGMRRRMRLQLSLCAHRLLPLSSGSHCTSALSLPSPCIARARFRLPR